MTHPDIYIDQTAGKGRGIFTLKDFPANAVIEVSPVIVMNSTDREHLDRTLLHDYIFEWTPEGEQKCCMALGYIPMYNHSYTSNCEYFMDYDRDSMTIKTVRPIIAGEELTINYNGDWNDERKVWFDAL